MRSTGKVMNKASDGITSQKILADKVEILSISFVSIYSHIIPMTDTSGMEARIEPASVLFLEISDINTTIMAVTTILNM